MALSGSWFRTWSLWPHPSHQLKIKNMQICVEVFTVPSSKDEHLVSSHKCCWMSKSSSRGTCPIRTLIPSHFNWIESMKISKNSWFSWSFSSKDQNSASGQYSTVSISWLWRCSFYLWFNPSWSIQIKYMSIIQVLIPKFLIMIVMTSKVENWSSD